MRTRQVTGLCSGLLSLGWLGFFGHAVTCRGFGALQVQQFGTQSLLFMEPGLEFFGNPGGRGMDVRWRRAEGEVDYCQDAPSGGTADPPVPAGYIEFANEIPQAFENGMPRRLGVIFQILQEAPAHGIQCRSRSGVTFQNNFPRRFHKAV